MKYLFDVDGVLCNTGGFNIEPEFKEWFVEWASDKEYYLVTGGLRESTIKQLGIDIVNNARMSFHSMGNDVWVGDKQIQTKNQFTLTNEERAWFDKLIENSKFPHSTGQHYTDRVGTLNFSVPGRNLTQEQRKEYFEWDKIHKEREHIIIAMRNKFPRFDAYIGGHISIDICLTGCNKSQVLEYFDEPVYFFGDHCSEYGLDYPLASDKRCITFDIKDGYKDTWKILDEIHSTQGIA